MEKRDESKDCIELKKLYGELVLTHRLLQERYDELLKQFMLLKEKEKKP